MGGFAVFKVGVREITVLHNRENWEKRLISAAEWDDKEKLMAGRCKVNKGLWCGATKNGRFAFLVDSCLHDDRRGVENISHDVDEPNIIAGSFLKGTNEPELFANFWVNRSAFAKLEDPRRVTYNLIIGDTTSGAVYHLSKPEPFDQRIYMQKLEVGVHTLSLEGVDSESPRDEHVRQRFGEIIGYFEGNRISLEKFAETVMSDRVETVPGNKMSAAFVEKFERHPVLRELGPQRYGTTSTTAIHATSKKDIRSGHYTTDTKYYEKFITTLNFN